MGGVNQVPGGWAEEVEFRYWTTSTGRSAAPVCLGLPNLTPGPAERGTAESLEPRLRAGPGPQLRWPGALELHSPPPSD